MQPEASRNVLQTAGQALAALPALAMGLLRRLFPQGAQRLGAWKRSRDRLHLAVSASGDGVWEWSTRTGDIYLSQRACELLGYAAEIGSARATAFLDNVHPDDRRMAQQALLAHLRSDTPYAVELRLRQCSGAFRWYLLRGQVVRDAARRTVRMAGLVSDLEAQKLAADAIRNQALQYSLIAPFGQLALENPPMDDLMTSAVQVVRDGLKPEFCRLLVVDSDEQVLLLKGAFGWRPEWQQQTAYSALEETEDRFIIGAREHICIDDFTTELRFKPSTVLSAHAIRSGAEVLICGAHGSYGLLGIYSCEVGAFTPESVNFLRLVTNTLAASADRKMVDERLTHLAQFDTLTTLPNRALSMDRLWQAIVHAQREKLPASVLFIDLDRFKIINDTLGHGAGDELLMQVARRVQACVRSSDSVGRLGGDEFIVILAHLTKPGDGASVAQKIVQSLSESFHLNAQEVYISASIGIAVYPEDGVEPDVLIKNADTAMYRAKEAGRNTYQFYLTEMNARAVERLKIETQLRGALERREFVLHFQPKVHIASGEISGFEALLRWQHPERGLVAPAQFLSILEDTGMIVAIGDWVVLSVCQHIRQWQLDGVQLRPVAINLSGRQFHRKHLDASIGQIVEASGVDPGLLEFELTESVLMSDSEAAVEAMVNLKARGFRLSVDDFGTGYSSLAYLKRFPLDALKIDRMFIRDVTSNADDANIAVTIINLAHSLKLKVVAEGVETEDQLAFLKAQACDQAQGYYFSQPLPAAELAALVTVQGGTGTWASVPG